MDSNSNSDSDRIRSDSEDHDESITLQTRNLNFMDLPKDIHMKFISMLDTDLWNKNIFLYTNLWSVIGALRLVNKSCNGAIHRYIRLNSISNDVVKQHFVNMTNFEEYQIRQSDSMDGTIEELGRIPTQNLNMYRSYYIGFIIVTILCLVSLALLSTLLFKMHTRQLGCKSWQHFMGKNWDCQRIDPTTSMICSLSTDRCICNNTGTITCQPAIPVIGFLYTTLGVDLLMLVGYAVMYGLCCSCTDGCCSCAGETPISVSSRRCIKRCGEFTWTYCLLGFFIGIGCFLYAIIVYAISV